MAGRGGRGGSTLSLFGCLACSAGPQATPPGYSHQGDSLWVLQDNQGPRVGEGEG